MFALPFLKAVILYCLSLYKIYGKIIPILFCGADERLNKIVMSKQ